MNSGKTGALHTVQYYETDQMGVVHHSNYIRWFEEARTEFLRQAGAGYDRMEREGILSPVVSVTCRYHSPARFGERVRIETALSAYTGVRLRVDYRVVDGETGTLRCSGTSEHCFLKEGRPVSLQKAAPEYDAILRQALERAESGAQ